MKSAGSKKRLSLPSEQNEALSATELVSRVRLSAGKALQEYSLCAREASQKARISDEQLETIYAAGFARYTQGRLSDARQIFTFLTIYAPLNVRYLKALAAVHFICGELVQALHVYSTLIVLTPEDSLVQKRYAQCQERIDTSAGLKEVSKLSTAQK
ncbi:MAG: tetratricopeptide repeat protein [Pseudomonadota bacterium]